MSETKTKAKTKAGQKPENDKTLTGRKFLSGSRARNISYVVEPQRATMDMNTGRTAQTPPLRAKFKDHMFDSRRTEGLREYAAFTKEQGQSLHERMQEVIHEVEEYLMSHPDWGRADGRGIFLDSTATISEQELRARGVKRRCIFMNDLGDEMQQCSEFVEDPESDFCPTHDKVVLAAVTSGQGADDE